MSSAIVTRPSFFKLMLLCTQTLLPEEKTLLTTKCELETKPSCLFGTYFPFIFILFWRSDQSRFPGKFPTVTVHILSRSSLRESLSVFMLFSEQRTSWSFCSAGSIVSSVLQYESTNTGATERNRSNLDKSLMRKYKMINNLFSKQCVQRYFRHSHLQTII